MAVIYRGTPAVIGSPIAVQTRCFAQPLRQALHTAARIGAAGVQIDARAELPPSEVSDTAARQLRKMLDDLNLRFGSVTFASRRGYANPQDLERRLAASVDAMRMASRLGARVLVLAIGALPPADDPNRGTLIEALAALSSHGSRLGVTLAAQCSDAPPTEMAELLSELPDGPLGVDLSPADVIRSGLKPHDFLTTLGAHVAHVYANDAVRGLGGAAAIDVELGRGSAEVAELLGRLEEFDYRGWVTVERRNSHQPINH
jgi:sugar phosphate isomerase/epimerase